MDSYSSAVGPVAYSDKSIWLCRIQGLNLRRFMWIEFLSLPALLTIKIIVSVLKSFQPSVDGMFFSTRAKQFIENNW